MDTVSLFLAGQREFGARVHEIGGRWADPTPDDDWDVGALVEHLIDEQRWVTPLLSGKSLAEADEIVKAMGSPSADRVAAWEEAVAAAAATANEPGVLDRTVELSRGPTPAGSYLGEMIMDLCIHSWDLGKAIGSTRTLPGELVDTVFGAVRGFGDLSAFGDMFKPAVTVPDNAPAVDQLVAYTGRNPLWPA